MNVRRLRPAVGERLTDERLRWVQRLGVAGLVVSLAVFGTAAAQATLGSSDAPARNSPIGSGTPAPEAEVGGNTTGLPASDLVIATAQRNTVKQGRLVAFGPGGQRVAELTHRDSYWDVEEVPNTSHTVLYTADRQLGGADCGPGRTKCFVIFVETYNLSTGERTVLYNTPRDEPRGDRWHDVDRVNDTHVLVANINTDELTRLNVETGERTVL